jgi:hypothetical protein
MVGGKQQIENSGDHSTWAAAQAAKHYLWNAPHKALDKTAFSLVFALYISLRHP